MKKWSISSWFKSKKKLSKKNGIVIGLSVVGGLIAIAVITFIFNRVADQQSVLHFLPEEKTTAYIEIKDLSSPSAIDALALNGLTFAAVLFEKNHGFDLDALKPHMDDGPAGIAFIEHEKDQYPVLFFKVKSKKRTLKFLEEKGMKTESLTKEGGASHPIYQYTQGQGGSFAFFGPYLFAGKLELLQIIDQVSQNKISYLKQHTAYQKSIQHLPRKAWINSYLNIKAFSFEKYPVYHQLFEPLKSFIDHLGVTVKKESNGLKFNTLLSIQPDVLKGGNQIAEDDVFQYELTRFIPSEFLAAYFGGSNLTAEWQNTLKTISRLNPAYGIVLEGLIRAQISRLFGTEVNLRDDIYPLFEDEYALSFDYRQTEDDEKTNTPPLGLSMIIRHSDAEFTKIKLAKLLEGFQFLAAEFTPTLKTFTLPDATESSELVADNTKLELIDENYKSIDIHCLNVKDSTYGFCYAVSDNIAILSNQPQLIKESIDLGDHSSMSLNKASNFKQTIRQLSKVSDEISFINFDNLKNMLSNTQLNSWMQTLPNSLDTMGWVKHYFDDGVSTEGYLLFK